jgi:hypothetical protein
MREYTYHPHQIVTGWCRAVRHLIEDHLEEFKQDPGVKQTWVLVGIEEEIPEKDVLEIMERYPNSTVILATKKAIKVQCPTCRKGNFQ